MVRNWITKLRQNLGRLYFTYLTYRSDVEATFKEAGEALYAAGCTNVAYGICPRPDNGKWTTVPKGKSRIFFVGMTATTPMGQPLLIPSSCAFGLSRKPVRLTAQRILDKAKVYAEILRVVQEAMNTSRPYEGPAITQPTLPRNVH